LQMSGQEMDGLDMPTETTHKKGVLLFVSIFRLHSYTSQHSLYFKAVRKWFDNPQKYEVTRDIGELLNKTEYEDDLNLGGVAMKRNQRNLIMSSLFRTRTTRMTQ
jgi:hypothetical protein